MENLLPPEYSTLRLERWLQKLKSGTTTKTTNYLHQKDGGMCCLGVECNVSSLKREARDGYFKYFSSESYGGNNIGHRSLHPEHYKLGLNSSTGKIVYQNNLDRANIRGWLGENCPIGLPTGLTELNDTTNMTHSEIADFIIEFPHTVLKKVGEY